jgi:hypothetical protein
VVLIWVIENHSVEHSCVSPACNSA